MRQCIDWKVLKTIMPYSRTEIARKENPDLPDPFPARVRLGNCRICWWLDEVMAWMERRPRG
jgi:predicted DNA-binding transcriptional regulator AlpA